MKLVNGSSWLTNLDQDVTPAVPIKTISSAFNVEATSLSGQMVRIFVPDEHKDKASELTSSIFGNVK